MPYIGLATYASSRTGKSSEALLDGYCRELFGTDPDKFIKAIKILGVSMPFAQAVTTGVQWNGMKDSLPAPENYLKKHLAGLRKTDPSKLDSFSGTIRKTISDMPEGIKLMSEFFIEAKKGFDVIEAWLTGARFLLSTGLIAQKILKKEKIQEIATILKNSRNEYETFLRRREDPLSAAKNAALAYDTLIEYFNN